MTRPNSIPRVSLIRQPFMCPTGSSYYPGLVVQTWSDPGSTEGPAGCGWELRDRVSGAVEVENRRHQKLWSRTVEPELWL